MNQTAKNAEPGNSLDPKGRRFLGSLNLSVYGASCLSQFPWGK